MWGTLVALVDWYGISPPLAQLNAVTCGFSRYRRWFS